MEKLLMDEKYAKVYYVEELKLGKIIWTGSPTHPEYKKPFMLLIDYSSKEPIENFLSDVTEQGVISPECRKWFEIEMIPQAKATGLKRAAVISSGNVFKKYYINMILSATNKFGMPLKVFSDQPSAINWLKEMAANHAVPS